MPCEACSLQFTVFRRKRSCTECKRLYCNQCLVKKRETFLCERCVIFTARPLSKVELLKLKPKDLIFYLQSKHISTTGCVEKEELVNLVLTHVNNSSYYSDGSGIRNSATPAGSPDANHGNATNQSDDENCTNPYHQFKQTCQNLFQSFTDKINTDLTFDYKPQTSAGPQNIFSQPRSNPRSPQREFAATQFRRNSQDSSTTHSSRSQTRVSDQHGNRASSQASYYPAAGNASQHSNSTSPSVTATTTRTTSPTSPIASVESPSSPSAAKAAPTQGSTMRNPQSPLRHNDLPSVHTNPSSVRPRLVDHIDLNTGSGCECSDDETILKFRASYKAKPTINIETAAAGESSHETANNSGPSASTSARVKKSIESSSNSSFEELGAVGGTSSDADTWQLVDNTTADSSAIAVGSDSGDTNSTSQLNLNNLTFQSHSTSSSHSNAMPADRLARQDGMSASMMHEGTSRVRRLVRRRSDGVLYKPATAQSPNYDSDENMFEESSRKRSKKSCNKCGKSKGNLKKRLAEFRRQLESTNTSEEVIKRELNAFLLFLENRARSSFEYSDSDAEITTENVTAPPQAQTSSSHDDGVTFDDNDGIHVYATEYNDDDGRRKQFLSLDGYSSSSDFEDLSVKQLKQILVLNRVDFKGCCEKTELLERVQRLWKECNTGPPVEKLSVNDLCKICMDAPIECVILECGHMATCTGCGKVLSECPICRQYIVRVVRFFRA